MLLYVKLQPQKTRSVEMRAKIVQRIKYEKLGCFAAQKSVTVAQKSVIVAQKSDIVAHLCRKCGTFGIIIDFYLVRDRCKGWHGYNYY